MRCESGLVVSLTVYSFSTLGIMHSHRRTYDYLIAHLLDTGNTPGGLRSRKFLFFRRNLAGGSLHRFAKPGWPASLNSALPPGVLDEALPK